MSTRKRVLRGNKNYVIVRTVNILFHFLVVFLFFFLVIPKHEAFAVSFIDFLLKTTGISATPSLQKGFDAEIAEGDIWVVDINSGESLRITENGGYHSPVFMPDDNNILALRGNTVVRMAKNGGKTEVLHTIQGLEKLVGFNKEDMDNLLIFLEGKDGKYSVGFLSLKSGQVTSIQYDSNSKVHWNMINHIKDWERVYGDVSVYSRSQVKRSLAGKIEWTDVFIEKGKEEPVNLTRSNGVSCGQPSLSYDGRQVVFVKTK